MKTVPIGQGTSSLFEAQGFTSLQIYNMVTQLKPGFKMSEMKLNRIMRKLAEANNGTQSIKAGGRVYKFPRIGNVFPYAVASSTTLSNADTIATITLSDNAYKGMGIGSIIQDALTSTVATITGISAGTIVCQYDQDPLSAGKFTSSDFAQGTQIKYLGYNGGTVKYQAADIALPIPSYDLYQIGNFSTDAFIRAEDAFQQTQFKVGGKDYVVATTEMNAIDQMMAAQANYMLSDVAERGGDKPLPASYINQIRTKGGMIIPKSSQWSREDFEDILDEWTSRGSVIDGEVFALADTIYARNVSRVLTPYTETAGKNNIFGADSGLDIRKFECSGIIVNLVVEQYYNNAQMNGGQYKDSALWFSPKGSATIEGKYVPPIVDVYYGQEGLKRTVIEGKTDSTGNRKAVGSNDQPTTQITYEMDVVKVIADVDKFMWHKGQ